MGMCSIVTIITILLVLFVSLAEPDPLSTRQARLTFCTVVFLEVNVLLCVTILPPLS